MSEIKNLKNRIEPWKELVDKVEDLQTLYDLAIEGEDTSLESEISSEYENINQKIVLLEF